MTSSVETFVPGVVGNARAVQPFARRTTTRATVNMASNLRPTDLQNPHIAALIIEHALAYAIFTLDAEGQITSWSPGGETDHRLFAGGGGRQ